MFRQFILISLTIILFNSCRNNQQESKTEKTTAYQNVQENKALSLMQHNCFSCHNPDKGIATKVAPSMGEIRNAYLEAYSPEESFISNFIDFINNPAESKTQMPEAISSYGLMPKLSFKEEELRLIAEYLYGNDMESEEWYSAWESFQKENVSVAQNISFEDLGRNIANGAKAQLGKNLLAAIKQRGTTGAVTFCNTRAITLTDSMANVYHASVKRVSDRNRNPDNKANASETEYIEQQKKRLLNGEKTTPKLFEDGDKMKGYYTIETNKMCLQCHGRKDNDITSETYAEIARLYPEDKATGYAENEVRGIWVITMNKN
jgi:cytochrome c551/c552